MAFKIKFKENECLSCLHTITKLQCIEISFNRNIWNRAQHIGELATGKMAQTKPIKRHLLNTWKVAFNV